MKTYRVIWSEQAKDDLREIYYYIFEQSKQGANSVFDTLLDLGDSLTTMPRRFPVEVLLADAENDYRFLPKWSYKIVYLVQEDRDRVIIARIY